MTDLACIPAAIPAAERDAHFTLARRLLNDMVMERRMLANGFAFRFDVDALDAVARFVANERKCCPFVDFEIQVAHNGGPLWLRMTGPDGTREALTAGASC
jgi:hypothetical protein